MKTLHILSVAALLLLPFAAGAYGMMDPSYYGGYYNMMGGAGGSLWLSFGILAGFVWLVAGVLLIVYLWKQITKR